METLYTIFQLSVSIIIAKQNVTPKREQGQACITCKGHDTNNDWHGSADSTVELHLQKRKRKNKT